MVSVIICPRCKRAAVQEGPRASDGSQESRAVAAIFAENIDPDGFSGGEVG
jgi:hypothetical protein